MNIPVLDPKGVIGLAEKDLIVTATILMGLVVIPVLVLTFAIAWRYRAAKDCGLGIGARFSYAKPRLKAILPARTAIQQEKLKVSQCP